MITNALNDKEFLKQLDLCNKKDVYVKIIALNIQEQPTEQIEGTITTGSISIDGSSAVRRTLSLTISSPEVNINDYYWGFSTKFQVYIGLKNNINNNYDNIIWFNQGIYVITSFNSSYTTSGYTINISGQDKMCLLNGSIGGSLPASVNFKENILYNTVYEPIEFGLKYKQNEYYVATTGEFKLCTADFSDDIIYYEKQYDEYEECNVVESMYKPNVYYIKNTDETTLYLKDDENFFYEFLHYYQKNDNKYTEKKLDVDTYIKNTYYLSNEYILCTAEDYDDEETYYLLKEGGTYEIQNNLNQYNYSSNIYYKYEPLTMSDEPSQESYDDSLFYYSQEITNNYIYSTITLTNKAFQQALIYQSDVVYYDDAEGQTESAPQPTAANFNEKTYYYYTLSNTYKLYEKNLYYIKDSVSSIYQLATKEFTDYPTNTQFYEKQLEKQYTQVQFTDINSAYEAHKYYIYDIYNDKFVISDDKYSPEITYYEKQLYQDITDIPISTIIREAVHFYGQELYHNIIINDIDEYGLNLMEYRGEEPIYLIVKDSDIIDYRTKDQYCYPLKLSVAEVDNYKKIMNAQLEYIQSQYENNSLTSTEYAVKVEKIKKHFLDTITYLDMNYIEADEFDDDAEYFYYDSDTKIATPVENPVEADINKYYIVETSNVYVSLDNSDYFTYNNLLEEYTNNPTPVIFDGDDDYTIYTIAQLSYGDAVGYEPTELVYPNELTSAIGDSLVSILDKIKNMFTNFEYFYDINGKFVFQKKKDYATSSWNNIITQDDQTFVDNTLKRTSSSYDFVNNKLIISIANTPKLDSVRNDFSVWGNRKGTNDAEIPIYGRMALDTKPQQYISFPRTKVKYTTDEEGNIQASQTVLITEEFADSVELLVQYRFFSLDTEVYDIYQEMIDEAQAEYDEYQETGDDTIDIEQITETLTTNLNHYELKPIYYQSKMYGGVHYIDYFCDWREIIYQMASDYYQHNQDEDYLINLKKFNPLTCVNNQTGYERYYSEMFSFWRDIYDTEPSVDYDYEGGKIETFTDYNSTEGIFTKTAWRDYTPDKTQLICDYYLPTFKIDKYKTLATNFKDELETKINSLTDYIADMKKYISDELAEKEKYELLKKQAIKEKTALYVAQNSDIERSNIYDRLVEANKAYLEKYAEKENEIIQAYQDLLDKKYSATTEETTTTTTTDEDSDGGDE